MCFSDVFLSNGNDFTSEGTEPTSEIDTSKLIDFKGLPVNHRFSTPVEILEIKHTEEALKEMYSNLRLSGAKPRGVAYRVVNTELPSVELITEAAKKVLNQFPYDKILGDTAQEMGSITMEELAVLKWEMIQKDFPTLNEIQITENLKLIDEYYEKNLNYVVLREISENEDALMLTIKNNYLTEGRSNCFWSRMKMTVYWIASPIRTAIAYGLASTEASDYAEDYYPTGNQTYYYTGGGGANTRGDAYRHTIWNALLADYYFTFFKFIRLDFAKSVADNNEACGSNAEDSKEMDYHNNSIGRKIWDDNAWYSKFLGIPYWLNTPSTSKIKNLVEEAVNEKSCFIVKKKGNVFPNNELTQTQTISQIKAKIDYTDSNTIVYFEGTISPSSYGWRYVFSHWEYYDCSDQQPRSTKPNKPCRRPVYVRQWGEIIPCYKL